MGVPELGFELLTIQDKLQEGHTVAMVTYFVTKMITRTPMIGLLIHKS